MVISHNHTLFDIPLTWNRTQFITTRNKCLYARKLIEMSINVQFEKQLRTRLSYNIEIEENLNRINEHLLKHHNKLRVLDNMIELASQSLRIYFDKRMEFVRTTIKEHCQAIEQIIGEEAQHWKEIHSIMNQNLLNPGDIRSRNNYSRVVQKSPAANIATIEEENDDNDHHVSLLLNGQTLTPVITQMVQKSKHFTLVPSIQVHIPTQHDNSTMRKDEQVSIRILPMSTRGQPFEIIETTFVIKSEETTMNGAIQNDGYNCELNGTYRAPTNQQLHPHLFVAQPVRYSQPNIPARLYFSPTILQDPSISQGDDSNEPSSSIYCEQKQPDTLGVVQDNTILDNNILLTDAIHRSKHTTYRTHNKPMTGIKCRTSRQENALKTSQKHITTRVKPAPVVVSARRTRSVSRLIAEREAAEAAAKALLEEEEKRKKRKTRKRKRSRSIECRLETSDDEDQNLQLSRAQIHHKKRKTKRYQRSKSIQCPNDSSDDELDHDKLVIVQRRKPRPPSKLNKRTNEQEQLLNNDKSNETNKSLKLRKTVDHEHELMPRKKLKPSFIENNEKDQRLNHRYPSKQDERREIKRYRNNQTSTRKF